MSTESDKEYKPDNSEIISKCLTNWDKQIKLAVNEAPGKPKAVRNKAKQVVRNSIKAIERKLKDDKADCQEAYFNELLRE